MLLQSCLTPVTPWTVARQAPLSMGLSGKNTGVCAVSSSRDLPNPGTEPRPLISPAMAGRFFNTRATWNAHIPCTAQYVLETNLFYI